MKKGVTLWANLNPFWRPPDKTHAASAKKDSSSQQFRSRSSILKSSKSQPLLVGGRAADSELDRKRVFSVRLHLPCVQLQ